MVLFLYSDSGGNMKIYLDVVFFINFMFDLLLLISVGLERKNLPRLRRFLLGAFLGSLSLIFLFFNMNSIILFLLKVVVSIFMVLGTFGYHNKDHFWANIKSLYGSSIILGGMLYVLNIQFSYKQEGFIFFHDGTSINLIIIIIASPIIFFLYFKELQKRKEEKNFLYSIVITYKNQTLQVQGYLDTGNTIIDPYKKRHIIILDNKKITPKIEEAILVPFQTVGHQGLLRCIVPDEIKIEDKVLPKNKYLIGFSNEKINLKGSNCILPSEIREELK